MATAVTIYATGHGGAFVKYEGTIAALADITPHTITFTPKRARRARMLMSYYAPTWIVVAGHGHPDPAPLFGEPMIVDGAEVRRGRHRGCSPEWARELLAGPVGALPRIASRLDGVTEIATAL